MNYSLKIKLLELTQRALMVRADAQPDNGDKWRTTETGSKILLGKDGTVKGGMGGKFNGKNIKEVGGTKKFTKYQTNKEREQGNEPTAKREPAKPVEVENKTLNSLTKQNESNKISSPSKNEAGKSGDNKMNVNIDSNKKILQSAIARHKKEYDLITHALTNSEWFKETKKEAGESNGASAADARQTVASASVSQKKLIETMEKAGIDMPARVKYLGIKDQPKVEEYNKKVYDAITKVASDFIKNNKDESKALAVKNSNSFADALAIMAEQQPEKTENATPAAPVAKKGNRAAVLTTGADAGKIQVEYGYNSKMYDELKKLKGAKYIKSGIFYVPSVHAKEVIELSKKHGLGLSDGFKESFPELIQDFETAKLKIKR